MLPTLLIVLYLTFMSRTVSVTAASLVAKENIFAPSNVELGYFIGSENDVFESSNILKSGC